MRELLVGAAAQGKRSRTLAAIIEAIQKLRGAAADQPTPAVNDNLERAKAVGEVPGE
jgi:hypothetical protein